MNCANSYFDHYFLQYLIHNSSWIANKHHLISWFAREALLKLAYYATWLRSWADSFSDPISSSWAYCRPAIEMGQRWIVIFGGLGIMMVIMWGVWVWMTDSIQVYSGLLREE